MADTSRAVSTADLDIGTWAPDDGIAFESAEWILSSLIASCSARAAAERAKPHPNPERLAAIAEERARYAAARRSLSVADPTAVREVVARYGPLAREHHQAAAADVG